jgi:hypothetical protein
LRSSTNSCEEPERAVEAVKAVVLSTLLFSPLARVLLVNDDGEVMNRKRGIE